jgi:hypothetical protein
MSGLQPFRSILFLFSLSIVATGLACGERGESSENGSVRSVEAWATEMGPPERFVWDDEPISFSPPPADWERQREQSGGLFGARFVKYESGGQAIHLAEVTAVGQRDRCSELKALLRDLDELSPREFQTRLQRARPYLRDPINRSEKDAFKAANNRLDQARKAEREGDPAEVRDRISAALWDLKWVEYTLSEVVEPVLFTGEEWAGHGEIELQEPLAGEIAGEPSLHVDYLFDSKDKDRVFTGRKVYIEHNNRLFEASFLGVEEYLPLFEAMVQSISFPGGACEH